MPTVIADSTDQSFYVGLLDASDGTDITSLAYSDITIRYKRGELGSWVTSTSVSLANATSAHADWGAVHDRNGVYRIDLPDAALASGVNRVYIDLTASGAVMADSPYVIDLAVRTEIDAILNEAMTESYPTVGSTYTLPEALYYLVQHMRERAIVGVNETILNTSGGTAATNTLNDATNPTAVTAET